MLSDKHTLRSAGQHGSPFARLLLREWQRVARQPLYWFAMVLAPLFCCLYFTTLMQQGLPESLPAGVVDEDGTSTSRNLVRNLDAFQMVSLERSYANVGEARRAMQRGEIYGFYLIPRGTASEAQRQRVPTLSFYTNYSYLVAGSLLYRDMRTMSELASGAAARSVLYARGATERQAMAYLQPVVIDMHPVGNPWLNYNVYLSNILIPGVLGLFVFMMTVYGLGTELKHRTAGAMMRRAGGSMGRALTAKLLVQGAVFMLTGTLIVLWLYGWLRFPCYGGLWRMACVMLLFIVACQGFGVLLFTLMPTLRLSLSGASLWGVISFSISGMSFPVMAMHPVLQGLAWLFPLRHYYMLYVNTALDGYPLLNAAPYLMALLAFTLLPALCLPRLRHIMLHTAYVP